MIDKVNSNIGQMEIAEAAETLTHYCHGIAKQCGWWDDSSKRNIPTLLMLCVSELAEAMEGDRKNRMDDHLPDRKMLEVELADCIIRIFDMGRGLGLDIPGAMAEKLSYNTQRADHKPAVRADGGKQY